MTGRTTQAASPYIAIVVALCCGSLHARSADATLVSPLTTDQIVQKMVAMNRARAAALRGYSSTCVYRVENADHGKSAELVVQTVFVWPDRKESTIVSQSGSSFLRTRVLNRLLETETESMQPENYRRRDMNPENYNFRLTGVDSLEGREAYVLEVTPKTNDRFLLEGRIWVDARDFGIVRMEGAPARNPSWWTTHIDLVHSYCKIGDFWLPKRIVTVAQVRWFGRSALTIDYKDYKIIEAFSPVTPAAVAGVFASSRSEDFDRASAHVVKRADNGKQWPLAAVPVSRVR